MLASLWLQSINHDISFECLSKHQCLPDRNPMNITVKLVAFLSQQRHHDCHQSFISAVERSLPSLLKIKIMIIILLQWRLGSCCRLQGMTGDRDWWHKKCRSGLCCPSINVGTQQRGQVWGAGNILCPVAGAIVSQTMRSGLLIHDAACLDTTSVSAWTADSRARATSRRTLALWKTRNRNACSPLPHARATSRRTLALWHFGTLRWKCLLVASSRTRYQQTNFGTLALWNTQNRNACLPHSDATSRRNLALRKTKNGNACSPLPHARATSRRTLPQI